MRFSPGPTKVGSRVAGVVALMLVLSACYQPLAVNHQKADPNTRPWWCNSSGGEGQPGSEHYTDMGITKGPLSWDDCLELSGYLDDAALYAIQWPTRGAAEADGWRASVNYAEGMGTHHARGNPLAGTFDPKRPTFLQFGGNGPNAKLVGMSWYVENGSVEPPEGFPGNNDWWHVHEYLCISNTSGLVIRDGQCLPGQDGASIYLGNYWLLHTWVLPGWFHEEDIFIGHHPCLLPGGPAEPHDPCWDMEHMEEMKVARFEPAAAAAAGGG